MSDELSDAIRSAFGRVRPKYVRFHGISGAPDGTLNSNWQGNQYVQIAQAGTGRVTTARVRASVKSAGLPVEVEVDPFTLQRRVTAGDVSGAVYTGGASPGGTGGLSAHAPTHYLTGTDPLIVSAEAVDWVRLSPGAVFGHLTVGTGFYMAAGVPVIKRTDSDLNLNSVYPATGSHVYWIVLDSSGAASAIDSGVTMVSLITALPVTTSFVVGYVQLVAGRPLSFSAVDVNGASNSTIGSTKFGIGASRLSWFLTGNDGVDASTNFLGSINAADVVFKRNNAEAFRVTATSVDSLLPVRSKPAGAAGIQLDPNSATGSFTLSLSPANLTSNRRVTFGDADLSITGGGMISLGGFTLTVPKTGTVPVGTGTVNTLTKWVTDINTVGNSTVVDDGSTVATTLPLSSKQASAAGVGLDHNSATGNFILYFSPANLTGNRRVIFPDYSMTWPATDAVGYLHSDGAGALTWGAGGSTTPGGSDTQVQFNDGGSAFGGSSLFTFNKTTGQITVALASLSAFNFLGTKNASSNGLTFYAGEGAAQGGAFLAYAGNGTGSGSGGAWEGKAGSGGTSGGDGGPVTIQSGGASAGNGNGGDVIIIAGSPNGSGAWGNVKIRQGQGFRYFNLDGSQIATTDKTFTFPNVTGTFALGAGTITSTSTNDVTVAGHTHAITASPSLLGNGTAQYQTIVTGATPFSPVYSGFLLDGTTGGKTVFSVTNTKVLTLLAADTYTVTIAGTASISGTNTGDVTLATDHGLSLTGQVLAMGTPSTITNATTNSVTTTTHTHAVSGTFTATAHNTLSATHGDTAASSLIQGDILYVNSAGKLTRLAAPTTPLYPVLQYDTTAPNNFPVWGGTSFTGIGGGGMNFAVTSGKVLTLTAANDFNLTVAGTCTLTGGGTSSNLSLPNAAISLLGGGTSCSLTLPNAATTISGGGTFVGTSGQTYTFGTTGGTIPTAAGTLTVSTSNAISAAGVITHAITSSSNPGAAASLLATDSAGTLTLATLIGTSQIRIGSSTSYLLSFLGSTGADSSIAIFGVSGFSNGFNILYKDAGPRRMVYQFADGGVLVGNSPTGGDKGVGTANFAADIYKNNVAYTSPAYALEMWATGKIAIHADKEGAAGYRRTTLDEAERYMRIAFELPGHRADFGLFGGSEWMLEKLEEAYTYIIELHHRIEILEAERTN